jgi:signal peptidase I
MALGAAGALFVRHYVVEGIYLASDSMAPTLRTGDHVVVNKAAFLWRKPRRGEIVMIHTPQSPEKDLVKRVIGLGGDQLEIRKKKVFINGELLDEPYVRFLEPNIMYKGDNIPPIQIPAGYVFVMGDNRDASGDSRDWKTKDGEWAPYVALGAIKGHVLLNK